MALAILSTLCKLIMYHLLLRYDWHLWLSMVSSRFIRFVACVRIFLPFSGWVICHCCLCHIFFWNRVSLCSPGCLRMNSIDQVGLELRDLPASDFWVLVCATTWLLCHILIMISLLLETFLPLASTASHVPWFSFYLLDIYFCGFTLYHVAVCC